MIQANWSFDWWYTKIGGVIAVLVIKMWAVVFRRTKFTVELDKPIDDHEATVMVANHSTLLDPPVAFSCLSFRQLWKTSPVKFMTWHKYYNGKFKLVLYTTGCYPSHGDGLAGVEAAVHYAKSGYRSFIFPEGRRIKNNQRQPAFEGVVKTLEQLPEARLILVKIDWEKRKSRFSRPKLTVKMHDAPAGTDRKNADKIMDAVYEL